MTAALSVVGVAVRDGQLGEPRPSAYDLWFLRDLRGAGMMVTVRSRRRRAPCRTATTRSPRCGRGFGLFGPLAVVAQSTTGMCGPFVADIGFF